MTGSSALVLAASGCGQVIVFDHTLRSDSDHSAFDNPAAPEDAPPRESIESRVLVKFD